MKRKRIRAGEAFAVRFTPEERDLVLENTFAGGSLERRLRMAIVEGSQLVVRYSLSDLDELLGFIAAEANHSKDRTLRERLERLYDRLIEYERQYEEVGTE